MKMSSWCYGIVKIDKQLVLCECYFNSRDELVSYCPVSYSELKTKNSRKLLIKDISSQLEKYPKYNFKESDIDNKVFD